MSAAAAEQKDIVTAVEELVVAEEKPHPSGLTVEERYQLCRSVGQECICEDELRKLIANKPGPIIAYDGFEPSGRMHIAQGVMKCINVNKLTKAGVHFKFWIADWFAQLNNKMGGDLKKIQTVGRYMNVEFLSSSEEINKRPDEYWTLVMDIARKNNLKRIIRQTSASYASAIYPASQLASKARCQLGSCQLGMDQRKVDKLAFNADICQLGMDQRKVNMLAREYCDDIKRKLKPVILSHRMMPGLLEGQEKMSKSDPNSAIFMEDTEAEVKTKIKKLLKIVEGNPCIEYVRYITMPWFDKIEITRPEANGGSKIYETMDELEADYASGALHPGDLKPALTAQLNLILQPVRDHFNNDAEAKDLLKKVKSYKVTK
eukprot:gene4979-34758_t